MKYFCHCRYCKPFNFILNNNKVIEQKLKLIEPKLKFIEQQLEFF